MIENPLKEEDNFDLPDWSQTTQRRSHRAPRKSIIDGFLKRIRRQPGHQERRLARKVDQEFVM